MTEKKTSHKLYISSLHDAMANCEGGDWYLMRTGRMTATQIREEFRKHKEGTR